MALSVLGISIDSLILHELARQTPGQPAVAPSLSSAPSPLDDDLREFIADKISEMTDSRDCFMAQFEPASSSPVPAAIQEWLAGRLDLVAMSRVLAQHLSAIQHHGTSAGLMAVAECAVGKERTLAVLKLENERGVRLERTPAPGGETILELQTVRDLILSERTRFFKQGYVRSTGRTIEVHVTDRQRPRTSTSGAVASFFLHRFLGCRLQADPQTTTRDFLLATVDFLNDGIADAAERQEAALDTASYLRSNSPTINVERFAEEYIPDDLQDTYVRHMKDRGIPLGPIVKDISLVSAAVKRVRFVGASGIVVLGPVDAIKAKVTSSTTSSDETELTIRDVFKLD